MKKIRIAFFADILVGDYDGATRTMFQLLQRIPAHYFEFLFICGVGPTKLFGFECVSVPTVIIPVNTSYKMALPALSDARVKAKLSRFAPDVVHIATPSPLGQYALRYANGKAIPVISIFHTNFIAYIDYYLKYTPIFIKFIKENALKAQRKFYNQCQQVYVPSNTISGELRANGVEEKRIKIWKRGIDKNLFTPAKRNVEFIRGLTGNERPVILFASRLVWEKNLETLFRIYHLLQEQGKRYNWIIAGNGTARTKCERHMPDAIFMGKVNHETLAALYASADVFVFPSVSETIGNVVLEAMASGLPCVIADGGGSQDFIEQGVNGYKCAPENEADYIAKIEAVLNDNALRESLSMAGLAYSKLFDWDHLSDVYFNDLGRLSALKNKSTPADTAA